MLIKVTRVFTKENLPLYQRLKGITKEVANGIKRIKSLT